MERGHIRHGLFFAHLALEKALKALVCRRTDDLAPRIHNLVHLGELAGLVLKPDQTKLLALMNTFQMEGRYPQTLAPVPTPTEAQDDMRMAQEMLRWLLNL